MKGRNQSDALSRVLDIFDDLPLDDVDSRRTALKPLYDYYQRLLLAVGTRLCSLDEADLVGKQLRARWSIVESFLKRVDDPKPWQGLVHLVHELRRRAEHEDYYDPPSMRLKEARKKAPDFREWIIKAGEKYYSKSSDFGFKEAFLRAVDYYVWRGRYLVDRYGDDPHLSSDGDLPYELLPELVLHFNARERSLTRMYDIQRSDLEKLIELVRIVVLSENKENLLLKEHVCPVCGGRIKDSQTDFGGSYDDAPTSVYWRVGCEECDYEIHSETIGI